MRVARWWSRLPLLGRLFVGLTVLDVAGRAAGFISPWLLGDLADPQVLLPQVLPRELVILLPALVLTGRADALTATPLIMGGAIALALLELAAPSVLRFSMETLAPQNLDVWSVLAVAWTLGTTAAWMSIGTGLHRLSAAPSSRKVRRLASVVAASLAAATLLLLLSELVARAIEAGNVAYRLASIFFLAPSLALAFVGWVAVRGYLDPNRPAAATRLAATALGTMGLAALVDLVLWLLSLAVALLLSFWVLGYGTATGSTTGGPIFIPVLESSLTPVLTSLFLTSFALGLGRPSAESA